MCESWNPRTTACVLQGAESTFFSGFSVICCGAFPHFHMHGSLYSYLTVSVPRHQPMGLTKANSGAFNKLVAVCVFLPDRV